MKSLIVVLVLMGMTVSAQHYKFLPSINIEIVKTDALNIPLDTLPPETVDIKGEFWDHTIYNPYRHKTEVEFPLCLKFKDTTYAPPVKKVKVVTSRFGWRRGRAHKGIDIDLVTGDSLFAMFPGIVRMARYTKGHGRTVVVRHYNGLETVYAHLSRYGVKENDTVTKGGYLGKGGVSGNARGSHLHLVINYKGIAINPEYIFKFNSTNAIHGKEVWVTKKWTQAFLHNSKRKSKITPLLSEEEAIASLAKQRSIYVVRPGDTLSRISQSNNVSVASLCEVNAIKRNTIIKIGQKLIIEK